MIVVALDVLLVDDLPVVRAGLARLLAGRRGFGTVTEAGTAEEALAALGVAPMPSIVVVGLGLVGPHDAFWLLERIRERHPDLALLACGARSDVPTISRALLAGAIGFVDKRVSPDEFVSAVRGAAEGGTVLVGPPEEWVGPIAERLADGRRTERRLSAREREVLTVAAEGLTAREIADRLGVRERTVTTHLSRIYDKLDVRTRIGALRAASAAGLVSLTADE